MDVDPSVLSTLLGIARPTSQAVAFPPEEIDKATISNVFGREGTTWFGKLQATKCLLEVWLLNLIFTYNIFSTTHNNDMLDTMVHVIISEARNSSTSRLLPYGVMILHLLEVCRVPFPKDATNLK